ncbi:hypothetical protein C900_00344 [Fulvivirga imtechensis AK7]|uniref:Uncharacterized protein n=1 Tax=Fulvivirga imtechensis AK7 TaxID=1237149 RepID=L8JI60_9BACT|nr:hypothetical protein C900_00344 [Fulvivirga imtechensis AK7]
MPKLGIKKSLSEELARVHSQESFTSPSRLSKEGFGLRPSDLNFSYLS